MEAGASAPPFEPSASAPPFEPSASAPSFADASPSPGVQQTAPPAVPAVPAAPAAAVEFERRFVIEAGRAPPRPPDPTRATFSVEGEYQLRYRAMTALRLEAPASDPGATTLGQHQFIAHWLRLTSRFHYKDKASVVAQLDLVRGLIAGDTTRHVDQVRDARAALSWAEVHPRYLYLEVPTAIGIVRLGQQGAHWGMGLVANDGERPSHFGDYTRGSLVERALLAATPMGRDGPLVLTVAGDLVLEDNAADLLGNDVEGQDAGAGDLAVQAVVSALWRARRGEVGIYGALRRQTRERRTPAGVVPFTEALTAGVIDVAGRFDAPVPGGGAHVYGEIEAAAVLGATTFAPSDAALPTVPRGGRGPATVRSVGGAATLGAVHVAVRGARPADRWGRVVTELEVGYASGDDDPGDGVARRFTFDPSHNVGLLLFDEVLAWKTARAATLTENERSGEVPAPGLRALPSKGGVFGAAYVNPRLVVRPARWLDLKAGAVIAHATADPIDPYRADDDGDLANYDGGDRRRRDLGVELDLGVDARIAMGRLLTIQLGTEAGAFFPGGAFNDAAGTALPDQFLLTLKLGLIH
ncbi:hypothetical protein [Sorangium cellulosum]|uniref:hypothetical protein n=1 Tax=Sorangium cellulosum TaxID=56 RepID=UPI001F1AF0CE|nr:hypothetical protein [Sorangium cellulosum]